MDSAVSKNQGLILNFTGEGINAARAVFRLSGTGDAVTMCVDWDAGSSGATIRLYLEVESSDDSMSTREACSALAAVCQPACL